jgi:biopolymer transport protein ExbB/TolQ
VGEALIMTAAGLAVAIPAVLAYNGSARHRRHRGRAGRLCARLAELLAASP